MQRLTLILLALIPLGVVLYLNSEPQGFTQRVQRHGPFPSDWFMLQRQWPDLRIDPADYLNAHRSAMTLRETRLDEHPPWIPAGPNNIGGRLTDIVGHPTNTQLFYVAAASGGVFKTVNGGSAWTPVFDWAPGLSMGALAIDLSHPDTVYAGTGEANSAGYSYFGFGLYRTADGGDTWTHLGLTDTRYIARVVVDQDNPQSIWVAAMGELYVTNIERGVYHSTDGGATWTQSLFVNDSTGASDVVINPLNPQIVYAGMWQRIRDIENRDVGGRGSGVFKSINGGESWTRLEDGLPPQGEDVGRIGLAICPDDPDVLYAIYADHPGYFAGIYRSADGGETWVRTNDGNISELYSSFGWYFGNVRVRPDNCDMAFALGQTLARTTNGGQTWTYIANSVHVDHHAMWFHPAQPANILLGNDGGLYRSTNNGNSWSFLPGLPVNQFYAATVDPQLPNRRYGGTQDQGTMRTLTGGLNDWSEIYGGDGFYCLVDPTNSNRIYAEYQYGGLGRSEDGGDSFDYLWWDDADPNERRNWSAPVVLHPTTPSTVFIGGERLHRSQNHGDTWESISPDLTDGGGDGNLMFGTLTTIGISPVNPQVIYCGTDDANVWVTQNGGASWQNRSAGLPDRWITRVVPDPNEINVVYVTISGFRNNEQDAHIFMSDDYGANWQNISGTLPMGPLNDVVPDSDIPGRLYVASDFGTFVTPDYGDHWMALGEDLPIVPVIQLILHNPTRILTAATYGRSMFTLNLNELIVNRTPEITGVTPADLDTIVAPQLITFSVEASDPNGDPLTYVWTRGGDTVSTATSVELQFSDTGVTEHIIVSISDGELSAEHEWSFYVAGAEAAGDFILHPSSFSLSVYPNPFNSTATIRYALPRAARVQLDLYDITGRKVSRLLSGDLPAGSASLSWTADELPSGTYFLHFQAADFTQTHKVLLIR